MSFNGTRDGQFSNDLAIAEIIITMLLDNFKFSLSEDEVVWKLANIQMPWVEKTAANGPSLPLMISRLA